MKKDFTKEEERKLIERAKQDIEAFGKLYDRYFKDIFKYVSFRVGNTHDAEDLTAKTFEKAMKGLKTYKWQGYSFKTWLYSIARNLIVDSYRKKTIELSIDYLIELPEDEQAEDPELKVKRQLDVKNLSEAITRLPDEQREIVYLRYIKQLTIAETMEATGKTIDSVKSLAKRAIKSLKDALNANNE